jgi:hypothetical protein
MLLAAAFIGSAVLKLFPIEPFELNWIEMGLAGWQTAPLFSRLTIGAEFFLGFLFLAGIYLRQFTLPAAFFLLIIFTIHLLLQIVQQGNQGDCGCFGIYVPMTPMQAIIKNGVLVLLLFFLWRLTGGSSFKHQKAVTTAAAIFSFLLPFILNPVNFLFGENRDPEAVNYALPEEFILHQNKYGSPPVDLYSGKWIVSFMTLTCRHCRQSARKMSVINQRHPEIPFFVFLNGKDEMLNDFFTSTRAQQLPHMKMNAEPFSKLTGGTWPQIWWVEEGMVVKKSDYLTLREEDILQWLNKR